MLAAVIGRCLPHRRVLSAAAAIVAVAFVARFAGANGGDLPAHVVLQGFIKPEGDRHVLLVRVPLVLLGSFALPKRGPGYLDLARVDPGLRTAAAATGRQIELFANGAPVMPSAGPTRVALPSDRSFESYPEALAHLHGEPLTLDTDVYWNQGFFDVELAYPTPPRADVAVRVSVAPELGPRIRLHLVYLPASAPPRAYDLPPTRRPVPLDPHWYETAWTFTRGGFAAPFALDRLAFVVCLVAPFRRFRSLLAIVLALTALQAVTLTASALDRTPDWRLLAPLFASCLAAAIVLLAIENVVAPSLRRRWLVASVLGVLGGFGLGHVMIDDWQFAGAHPVAAIVAFNVGVALAEIAALALAVAVLTVVLRRALARRLGVVIASLVLGHAAWHWMLDSGHGLEHASATILATGSTAAVSWWVLLGLLVGAAAWFVPVVD